MYKVQAAHVSHEASKAFQPEILAVTLLIEEPQQHPHLPLIISVAPNRQDIPEPASQ